MRNDQEDKEGGKRRGVREDEEGVRGEEVMIQRKEMRKKKEGLGKESECREADEGEKGMTKKKKENRKLG